MSTKKRIFSGKAESMYGAGTRVSSGISLKLRGKSTLTLNARIFSVSLLPQGTELRGTVWSTLLRRLWTLYRLLYRQDRHHTGFCKSLFQLWEKIIQTTPFRSTTPSKPMIDPMLPLNDRLIFKRELMPDHMLSHLRLDDPQGMGFDGGNHIPGQFFILSVIGVREVHISICHTPNGDH